MLTKEGYEASANKSNKRIEISQTGRGGKRKGAGPKFKYGEETIQFSSHIPISLFQAIDKYAEKHNLSRNEAIIQLLFRSVE